MSTDSVTPARGHLYRRSKRLIVEPCPTAEQDIMPARFETKTLGLA